MKRILIIVGIIVVLFGLLVMSQKNTVLKTNQATQFSQIQKRLSSGDILLDVRTADEYKAGHIDGAINLSLQDIEAGALPNVTKSHEVYVYCHTGNRSAQATAILEKAGYTVSDLGAISNVALMGGTIVK